jgi:tRNA pseudouridine55 synthase
MTGFLLINKPSGPTSHDIVDRIRRITGEKRVGHAGTLDPFASGVLLVGVGREATREFSKLTGLDKRYRATLHLGATSDTDDRTGAIKNSPHPLFSKEGGEIQSPPLEQGRVGRVLQKFIGKIEQIPPMYSAKKIKGKKFYELARAGQTIERKPTSVEMYSIEAIEARPLPTRQSLESEVSPLLVLDIHCSSGTYIRALARDLGEALGCGAYLEELDRTAVGPFSIEEAVRLDDLAGGNIENLLIPKEKILSRCHKDRPVLG